MQGVEKSKRSRCPEIGDPDDIEEHEPAIGLPDTASQRADQMRFSDTGLAEDHLSDRVVGRSLGACEKVIDDAIDEAGAVRDTASPELADIRRQGYAFDDEEHEVGVRCVAAPVRNNQGVTIAALSISMPSVRLPDSEIPHYRDLVTMAADEISQKIGAAH